MTADANLALMPAFWQALLAPADAPRAGKLRQRGVHQDIEPRDLQQHSHMPQPGHLWCLRRLSQSIVVDGDGPCGFESRIALVWRAKRLEITAQCAPQHLVPREVTELDLRVRVGEAVRYRAVAGHQSNGGG